MASIDHSLSTSRPASAGWLSRAVQAFLNWNSARQTRNLLMKLSDRELADIGVCRDDIDQLVKSLSR